MYGDPEMHDLKAALAAHHGVRPENIAVDEGIDGLFGYLVRLLVEPGMPVVTSPGAYPTFNYHVAGFGGRLVTVPYAATPKTPRPCSSRRARKARRSSTSPTRTIHGSGGPAPHRR